jgi:hypothetical protein
LLDKTAQAIRAQDGGAAQPQLLQKFIAIHDAKRVFLKDGAVLRLGLHAAYDTKVPGG